MTDENGAGSWHLNLRNSDFPELGTYALSVWINEAGRTVLISDNFDVVVDKNPLFYAHSRAHRAQGCVR
jgi:hypothetical protein